MAVVRGADGQSGRGGRGRVEIDDESTRHQSVTAVHRSMMIGGGDTRHGLWGEGFVTCDRAPLSRCVSLPVVACCCVSMRVDEVTTPGRAVEAGRREQKGAGRSLTSV
jgi:hypothetical protein